MADSPEVAKWLGIPQPIWTIFAGAFVTIALGWMQLRIEGTLQKNGADAVKHAEAQLAKQEEVKTEVSQVKDAALSNVAVTKRVEAGVKAIPEAAASAAAKAVEEKQAAESGPPGI